MQGFFIKASGSNPYLIIPQSSQLLSTQSFYKSTRSNELMLSVEKGGYQDALLIAINDNTSPGFDPLFDVEKLYGTPDAPQFYTISDNKKLSVNACRL